MLKIQITAKAIWNGLFLYFIGYALAFFAYITASKRVDEIISLFCFFGALLCLGLLIFLLNKITLPLRLFGSTSITAEPNWQPFFIQINRLACILVGLTFLSASLEVWTWAISLIVDLPPSLRNWVTLWVQGNINEAIHQTVIGAGYLFYPCGYLLYGVFLIFGGDIVVRRQVRQFEQYLIRESVQ